MFQIDESMLASDRTLITINGQKETIDRTVKNGTLNYVADEINNLYLTIPTTLNGGEFNRVIQESPDGTIPGNLTFAGDVTIDGSLVIVGSKTIVDTPNLSIADNIIELNRDEVGAGITLGSAGIQINRGTSPSANWLYDENTDRVGHGAFVNDLAGSIKLWVYDDGNAKILGDLDVQNINSHAAISSASLSTTGASTIGGALTVSGATNLNSTLNTSGAATFLSTITATSQIWGKSTLKIDGASTLTGAATLGNTLTVTGATTLNSTLGVTGAITGNSTLNITGAATFGSTINATGNIISSADTKAANFSTTAVDGNGFRLWDSDNSKITMSSAANATYGGRLGETTSDYNMYFKMSGGTNRGFVFKNGTGPVAEIDGSGILRTISDIYTRDSVDTTKWYKVYNEGNLPLPVYNTTDPALVAVGGIPVGYLPPAGGIPIADLFYNALHPYTKPIVTLGTTYAFGLYETGVSISGFTLSSTITKKSGAIASAAFYDNGTLINTASVPAGGGSCNYVYPGAVTSNSTFEMRANDGSTDTSTFGTYSFTYPLYVGAVSTGAPTETDIKTMTKRIVNKSNQSYTYTIATQRMCIAYPMTFGNLLSVIDPNNFDVTASFTKLDNVNVTCLDGAIVPYKVYVGAVTSQSGYAMQFKFS